MLLIIATADDYQEIKLFYSNGICTEKIADNPAITVIIRYKICFITNS